VFLHSHVCMYLCMYICIYVCVIFVWTWMFSFDCVYICICICICIYVYYHLMKYKRIIWTRSIHSRIINQCAARSNKNTYIHTYICICVHACMYTTYACCFHEVTLGLSWSDSWASCVLVNSFIKSQKGCILQDVVSWNHSTIQSGDWPVPSIPLTACTLNSSNQRGQIVQSVSLVSVPIKSVSIYVCIYAQ